jgi:hypothetical protein
MRFNDLFEYSEVDSALIDLLTVLSAEGIDTISMKAVISELESQGHDVDEPSLFDEIQKLPMIHNIKDGVIRFHTSSKNANIQHIEDPEKDEKVIDKMARKQVKKELKK